MNNTIPSYSYTTIPLWDLLNPETQVAIVAWQNRHYPRHKFKIQDPKPDIIIDNPDREML